MGIFDFVKDAGNALQDKIQDITKNEPDVNAPVTIPQERIDQLREEAICRSCDELELDIDSINVNVTGEQVVLTGSVPDQATCEKVMLAAGNQHGIAQVDCQLDVEKPEPEATFYTVKSGDTLGKIAQEHYGSAGKYQQIFEANQPILKDPNKIYPGQQLRIPAL